MRLATLPKATPRPVRAVIYCRISLAAFGDKAKVKRQEKMCRAVAKRLGWEVVHVYCDNNRSAWKRNRKREDWDAMLAAVERGEIDAIIFYHGDRLIRQPWDLELLLNLADGRGIRLASPTTTRNLDDPDDRYRLRGDAARACSESDAISRRTRDAHADRAAKGILKKGGNRPFGYKRSGKIKESEAAEYRDAVARILAGESKRSIVREWNKRGVLTTRGNAWTGRSLQWMLRNPRYAGLSAYKGEIVGKARWKPVIERDQWEALQATLGAISDRYGPAQPDTSSKYLLTYLATCGPCGTPVKMHHSGQGAGVGYICANPECQAHPRRNMASVDQYVIGSVLRRLADPQLWKILNARPADDGAGAELAGLEAKRKAAKQKFTGSLSMSVDELDAVLRDLDGRIETVRERIAARGKVHVLHGCQDMSRQEWDALPLDRRRAIVKATVTVEILPSRKGRNFDPASVRVLPVEIVRPA